MTVNHHLSVWDRLVSEEQEGGLPVMTQANKEQMIRAVVKDLTTLLNEVTSSAWFERSQSLVSESALAYGLPPVTGKTVSKIRIHEIAQWIDSSIRRFEPRIAPESLRVHVWQDGASSNNHVMAYAIKGTILCEPHPVELELQARMDLDSGRFVSTQLRTDSRQ